MAPLRMHSRDLKKTLGSLKSVFNGLGGDRRWVSLFAGQSDVLPATRFLAAVFLRSLRYHDSDGGKNVA